MQSFTPAAAVVDPGLGPEDWDEMEAKTARRT